MLEIFLSAAFLTHIVNGRQMSSAPPLKRSACEQFVIVFMFVARDL